MTGLQCTLIENQAPEMWNHIAKVTRPWYGRMLTKVFVSLNYSCVDTAGIYWTLFWVHCRIERNVTFSTSVWFYQKDKRHMKHPGNSARPFISHDKWVWSMKVTRVEKGKNRWPQIAWFCGWVRTWALNYKCKMSRREGI